MYLFIVSSNNQTAPKEQLFLDHCFPSLIILVIIIGSIFSLAFTRYFSKSSVSNNCQVSLFFDGIKWENVEQDSNAIDLAFLTTREIFDWFYSHKNIRGLNENVIAFTVAGKVKSSKFKSDLYDSSEGKYNLIQGFYDRLTGELIKYRVISSNDIDDDLKKNHQSNQINHYS